MNPSCISLIPSHPHTFHTLTRPTLSHFLTYPTPSQVIWEYPGETKLQCTCWQFNRRMWYVLKHQLCMDGCMDPDILSDWFWTSLMLRSEFCYEVNFEQLAVAENEPRASPGLYLSDLTTQWAMTTTRQQPTLTASYMTTTSPHNNTICTAQALNASVAHLATQIELGASCLVHLS